MFDGPNAKHKRAFVIVVVMMGAMFDAEYVYVGGLGVVCASWAACGNGL